eukprot:8061520-Ditylum_brightwellii.AAC.1
MLAEMSDFGFDKVQTKEIEIYEALLQQGRTYIDETSTEMIEFHIDVLSDECFKELKSFIKSKYYTNHGLDGNTLCLGKIKVGNTYIIGPR